MTISLYHSLTPVQNLQLVEILRYAVIHNEGVTLDIDQVETFYSDLLPDLEKQHTLLAVAEKDGKIVGSIISRFYTVPNNRHLAYFEKLIVHPDFRNQGIGTKLVRFLEEQVRNLGKERIELSVRAGNPAQKLYEKLGYHVWGVAKNENKIGEKYIDEVYMEKLFV